MPSRSILVIDAWKCDVDASQPASAPRHGALGVRCERANRPAITAHPIHRLGAAEDRLTESRKRHARWSKDGTWVLEALLVTYR